jgi:hypothetical protein
MTRRLLLLSLLLLLIPGKYNMLSAQRFQSIKQAEDTLVAVLATINQAKDDSLKNALNQIFADDLSEALKFPLSDSYPFESLKTLVIITSPDKKFRIFHWNLPSGDGKHRYFGFIKLLGPGSPKVYPLTDLSDSLQTPDTLLLDNMHWFGALYYKVIPGETASGVKMYTLLGWAGRSTMMTQKVIEIISFDDQGKPLFGLKLFPDYHGGNMTRIIFRFAATTTMSLKYEKQAIPSDKKWNSKKRVFESTLNDTQMIVCDRLVPLDPQLESQYQFYVPAGDISDGFIFRQYVWTLVEGIDTKNKK